MPHDHKHHHHHAHLPQDERNQQIRRITWIGLSVNVALTIFELICGLVGHSQAIVADSVHTLSDFGTDLVLLMGIRAWSKPRDKEHPFGHERIETVLALFMGLFLILVGVGIAYNSLQGIREKHLLAPGIIAPIAAGVVVVSKEILFRVARHVGRKTASIAVEANSWHYRSDAMDSLLAGLAVLGAVLLPPQWAFLDHIGALMVCGFLFFAAYKVVAPAVAELLDTVPQSHVPAELVEIIAKTEGVMFVHAVRVRSAAARVLADAHIEVDPNITVTAGHDIAECIKQRVLTELPEVAEITIHIEPHGDFHRHPHHLNPIEQARQPECPDDQSRQSRSVQKLATKALIVEGPEYIIINRNQPEC